MKKAPEKKQATLTAKAALAFGSGTLTSRILGLIRDKLIFYYMPIDMKDAWLAAFRVPNFFRRLLGEGGLSVSFIPVYITLLGEDQKDKRETLAKGVFTLLLSVVALICLLGFAFMDSILPLWLSGEGFVGVPGKMEMAISMARIMIFFLLFVTLFAFYMALLNSHKKFAMSGFAPMFLNVAIISGLFLFKDGDKLAEASAMAVVVGGFLQAAFLFPSVFKMGINPSFTIKPLTAEVKKVLLKFVPTVFGVGVLQILAMVNLYFASKIQGAVSYIYLGDRLLELPLSLIAVSIGTTLLPTLSGLWSSGEKEFFASSIAKHLSLFYFLAIPSAFGLWFLGTDISGVLFRGGEFSPEEVNIVGGILKIYCLTLLAAGSLKVLNQALYATGDTLTPAKLSAAGLVIHLVLAPVLMSKWGINGLVLSTALVSLFNLIGCVTVIQLKLVSLNWLGVFKNAFCCFSAGAAMGAYLYFVNQFSWQQGKFLTDFPILLVIIAGGAVIYFGFAAIFKVEELSLILNKLKKRL